MSYLFLIFFFFLMIRRPPRSTLFPYTTLFRSLTAEFFRLGACCTAQRQIPPNLDQGSGTVTALDPFIWPSSTTRRDRKSTRLNSSHANISYAVFCLKKKKKKIDIRVD